MVRLKSKPLWLDSNVGNSFWRMSRGERFGEGGEAQSDFEGAFLEGLLLAAVVFAAFGGLDGDGLVAEVA